MDAKRQRGRPPLPEALKRSETLTVKVTRAELTRLEKKAKRADLPMAAWLRTTALQAK